MKVFHLRLSAFFALLCLTSVVICFGCGSDNPVSSITAPRSLAGLTFKGTVTNNDGDDTSPDVGDVLTYTFSETRATLAGILPADEWSYRTDGNKGIATLDFGLWKDEITMTFASETDGTFKIEVIILGFVSGWHSGTFILQ